MTENYKSGFAAIIGMPNVGKSTLLNKIAGQKVAIVSPKPQTTRNKILAIHTTDKCQVVFTDTPGIHRPRTKLGEYMVKVAKESMSETDILIFVVDATRSMSEMEKEIAKAIDKKDETLSFSTALSLEGQELLDEVCKTVRKVVKQKGVRLGFNVKIINSFNVEITLNW